MKGTFLGVHEKDFSILGSRLGSATYRKIPHLSTSGKLEGSPDKPPNRGSSLQKPPKAPVLSKAPNWPCGSETCNTQAHPDRCSNLRGREGGCFYKDCHASWKHEHSFNKHSPALLCSSS